MLTSPVPQYEIKPGVQTPALETAAVSTALPTSVGPAAPWLCAGFLVTGMGTVMLGPILPMLSHQWHLSDRQAGFLLFAKFIGAFIGGSTVPKRLRIGILIGLLASCLGFIAFALAGGLYTGAFALLIAGIGLGQIIASTNILAGRRYQHRTGSALSIINIFWSLGAVLTGVFVAALLPHYSLQRLLLTFAGGFVVIALGGRLHSVHAADSPPEAESTPLSSQAMASFGLLLFLYGGLETSLSQWITTFAARYTSGQALAGQSAVVILWAALTTGRLLTSIVLRRMGERTVQRVGLLCTMLLIPILAICTTPLSLSICCILLGLSLSPFFPSTFALLIQLRPGTRSAGLILAVSGIGAALLSWLTGILSDQAGSLRVAMAVPFAAAVGLFVVSFWTPGKAPDVGKTLAS